MSTRSEVLLWAQRVVSRKGGPAHTVLEIKETASVEEAQDAFHKIARTAHPDLHRNGLVAEELELVTSAYAAAAGAYQTFRSQAMTTQRMKPFKPSDLPAGGAAPVAPSAAKPATPSGAAPAGNASQSMSSRAIVYYRKAELALRRGDLKGALLQLKMAIAADPQSPLLRTALAEVELELRKGT